jgi:hypothetical protein
MAEALNRLGFRLRKVVKAQPQKKIAETDAIFAITSGVGASWNCTGMGRSSRNRLSRPVGIF